MIIMLKLDYQLKRLDGESIENLLDEKDEFEQMFGRITSGYIPRTKFDTSIQTVCYLFGCIRHNHPEYK